MKLDIKIWDESVPLKKVAFANYWHKKKHYKKAAELGFPPTLKELEEQRIREHKEWLLQKQKQEGYTRSPGISLSYSYGTSGTNSTNNRVDSTSQRYTLLGKRLIC